MRKINTCTCTILQSHATTETKVKVGMAWNKTAKIKINCSKLGCCGQKIFSVWEGLLILYTACSKTKMLQLDIAWTLTGVHQVIRYFLLAIFHASIFMGTLESGSSLSSPSRTKWTCFHFIVKVDKNRFIERFNTKPSWLPFQTFPKMMKVSGYYLWLKTLTLQQTHYYATIKILQTHEVEIAI